MIRVGGARGAPPARQRAAGRLPSLLAALVVLCAAPGTGHAVEGGDIITPEFAQALFDKVAPLQAADGCRLVRFDTSRDRITIGLQAPSGGQHAMDVATIPYGRDAARTAGDWALAVPAALERECPATLASIETVLASASGPSRLAAWIVSLSTYSLLTASFALLVLGSAWILVRETLARRPPLAGVAALALVWVSALALRLLLSPRTFLHEYYHIAETISGYLVGEIGPTYGKTGPALFRFAGWLLGRRDDVDVIFLTNAVVSSLAIPAVALLDLALMRSWPRAVCAGVLLAVLPQHLRFSAAEDLFVLAVTFGFWALALFAGYLRSRRLFDAVMSALALSLAMQTRPEMLLFPAVPVALVLLLQPRSWRVLVAWRTLLALLLLAALLIPRLLEFQQALRDGPGMAPGFSLQRYVENLLLFQPQVTPPVYWAVLFAGAVWTALRRPALLAWVLAVFAGFSLFSFLIFDNPPYRMRSQLLPVSYTVLLAAGVASAWMGLWGRRHRLGLGAGAAALAALAAFVLIDRRGFVTELRDQQLQWRFLRETVPRLPARLTLLSAVEIGGHNLDAFPEFLLQTADKTYRLVDVRQAARGQVPWPAPAEDLLFYQGMYCYFAFHYEPPPEPMSAPCLAVHERYRLEPLVVEDLDAPGYSLMTYTGGGSGPFRVGFYRVVGRR